MPDANDATPKLPPSQRASRRDALRHPFQPAVADAERLQMFEGARHIGLVVAGLANSARYHRGGISGGERAGILLMPAVGDVGDRIDPVAVFQPERQQALQIDARHLLTRAQVGHDLLARITGHPERHADAGAAPVETQHQARPGRGAAMDEGIDAKRTTVTEKPGALRLDMGETGPPHQRTVAKNPKIAHIAKPVRHYPRCRAKTGSCPDCPVP